MIGKNPNKHLPLSSYQSYCKVPHILSFSLIKRPKEHAVGSNSISGISIGVITYYLSHKGSTGGRRQQLDLPGKVAAGADEKCSPAFSLSYAVVPHRPAPAEERMLYF